MPYYPYNPSSEYEYCAEPFVAEVDQLELVNMEQVNVQDAKTRFSELLHLAERGEDVVIARAGRPVARLVRIAPPTERRLGFLKGTVPDDVLEPMSETEVTAWERPLIS